MIERGDIVLVHSSISRASKFWGSAERIFNDLRTSVGQSGVLMFPLFNYDFCKGVPFDPRTTKSEMGVLTEYARMHPDAVRTGHPVYNFAVIGERKPPLTNYEGFGKDSPFAWLHKNNGKIAILDLNENEAMTFYHYVEQCCNVPYRHHKVFRAGNQECSIFSRNKGVKTAVNPMGELLWSRGLYGGNRPGHDNGLRVINAAAVYFATKEVIDAGDAEGMLWK